MKTITFTHDTPDGPRRVTLWRSGVRIVIVQGSLFVLSGQDGAQFIPTSHVTIG